MSTEPKSRLHLSALQWAAQGFFVFPIVPSRKEPAVKEWEKVATTDAAQIDAWWMENPNYNIGFAAGRSDSLVVDVDPPLGEATLKTLPALPPTFETRTPRAGRHLFFNGNGPTSVGTETRGLGPKIDTRSVGGYVLVPPSVVGPGEYANNPEGGSYDYESQIDLAPLPEWVAPHIDQRKERHSASDDINLDQATDIECARKLVADYIVAGDVAIQGAGGDDRTYRICAELADLGLSFEAIAEVLDPWNEACQPRWEDEDLAVKIRNALEYRQNEHGAFAVEPAAVAFKDYAGPDISAAVEGGAAAVGNQSRLKRSPFYPMSLEEAAALPAPRWLIPGFLQANSLAVFYGRHKSFKSFLARDLSLGIAAGIETFGHVPEPGCIVYAVGEGPFDVLKIHAPAWKTAKQISVPLEFYVVARVPKIVFDGNVDGIELVKQIQERKLKPHIVVIDTMARALGGMDENSSKDVGLFVSTCDYIREMLGCTVLVIHHSGKDKTKGSRGSSALEAAADTVVEIERHEKTMYVSATVRDQRNAAEREKPFYFEGRIFGDSLMFYPMEATAFLAAVQEEHITSKKNVAAALDRMGAKGEANGVSSASLASELCRGKDHDENAVAKALNKGARKSPLNAYCGEGASGLVWFLLA